MKNLTHHALGLLALVVAARSQAQELAADAKASASPELFSAAYLFQVLGSLLLVFVCLFAVVYFLKRFNGVNASSGSELRILGSASVGQREKIVLLEVGGEQLLIGVAPGAVRTLHVLPEPVVDAGNAEAVSPNFAAVLRAANPLGSRS